MIVRKTKLNQLKKYLNKTSHGHNNKSSTRKGPRTLKEYIEIEKSQQSGADATTSKPARAHSTECNNKETPKDHDRRTSRFSANFITLQQG